MNQTKFIRFGALLTSSSEVVTSGLAAIFLAFEAPRISPMPEGGCSYHWEVLRPGPGAAIVLGSVGVALLEKSGEYCVVSLGVGYNDEVDSSVIKLKTPLPRRCQAYLLN